MYYSLVIKGNRQTAERAAAGHGLTFTFGRETERETVGYAPARDATRIVEWYAGDPASQPPMPAGTLLFYSELPGEARAVEMERSRANHGARIAARRAANTPWEHATWPEYRPDNHSPRLDPMAP